MIGQEVLIAEHTGVSISLCNSNSQNCMMFRFRGKFTEAAARKSIESWSAYQDQNPDSKLTHVWVCTNMTGFDNSAKNLWLDQMNAQKTRINSIKIISDNIVIRGAARLMSKFTNHELEVLKSEAELNLN